MQVNVAGLRRNIKNLAHNYSDAQVKVREATSNDPWGPSATIMAEVADLTYNVVAFSEIMQMIWKRLNDHGKNWRHVYKALILLEYLIKTGTEKVAQQCKENIFAIQTLREFVYFEEGKDQGTHVREKAKQLVNLLKDDERLKAERFKALRAKERFNEFPSGFGSDGYIDGPSHRDMPPGWQEEPKTVSELEMVRPQTAGEEELQLQLAMAMSREEAEQEEAKRRSDDVRLQLALSQSEQDFNGDNSRSGPPKKKDEPQSHLLDLLDISLGATSISSPPLGAVGGSGDPWGTPARASSQLSDPWSGTSSPPIDPWQPSAAMRSATASAPLGAVGGVVSGTNGDAWAALRTQSPSVASGSSTEGWLHSNGGGAAGAAAINGNLIAGAAAGDPWYAKTAAAPLAAAPSLLASSNATADPWLNENTRAGAGVGAAAGAAAVVSDDPWAPKTVNDDPWKTLETTGVKKPSPDMDEFDIITNRNKTGDLLSNNSISGPNNNNASLLDDLDPLSLLNSTMTTNSKKQLNTPQAFLGENSSLVNLDNLIKPIQTQTQTGGNAAYNPFSDTIVPPPKTNLFQQQQPAVPSINQLKQQQPFAMTINQDPWAPVANSNAASQKNVSKDSYLINYDSDELETNSQLNASITNNNNGNSNRITTTAIINNSQYQQQQMQYSKSDYDVFNTSHLQNEFYNNNYNNKYHNNNSNSNNSKSSNNSFYSSHSVDNIRDMQITTDSYEKSKPNELSFNYFSYSSPNNQSTNTTTSTNNNSNFISSSTFTAQFNAFNNNTQSNNNSSSNHHAATTTNHLFSYPVVDASPSSSSSSPPPQMPPPLPLLTSSSSASFSHIHAGGGYSNAFAASLASTPGIKISPLISSLGNDATGSGGEGGGGSLFSYGFYDENAPNTLTLGNCKMLDNNNNNNNMPWIKPEATAASSNPFLS